ncbi:MAG: hypothetical protein ACOX7Q_14525 [Kiritimatiellia bacterium]
MGRFVGNSQEATGTMGATGAYANLIYIGMADPGTAVTSWDKPTGLTNLGGTIVATHAITRGKPRRLCVRWTSSSARMEKAVSTDTG